MTTTYWNQDGEFQNLVTREIRPGRGDFWVVDAAISYRLPKRYGIITAGATNLFDEEFKYFDDSDNPMIEPDRKIFVTMTVQLP